MSDVDTHFPSAIKGHAGFGSRLRTIAGHARDIAEVILTLAAFPICFVLFCVSSFATELFILDLIPNHPTHARPAWRIELAIITAWLVVTAVVVRLLPYLEKIRWPRKLRLPDCLTSPVYWMLFAGISGTWLTVPLTVLIIIFN